MKASWNYLSDKLSIPVSLLTKENVTAELVARKIPVETAESIINILNACEFARYAPNNGQTEMGNLYEETAEIISNIENTISKA